MSPYLTVDKPFFYPVVFLVFCLNFLYGCSEPVHDSIRFGLSGSPVSLDPRFATDAESARINRLLYQQLVDFDAQNLPIPALASWQLISPTQYRFTLNLNHAVFHDGQSLSSADVKTTYDFILDETNASPHRGALKDIDRIELIDDKVIDFHLKVANPLFPSVLTVGIVPAHLAAVNHPFNRQPVGSGLMKLLSWNEGGSLLLQRLNDGQKISLIPVKDPVVRVLKLLSHELDLLQSNLSAELIAWLKQRDDVVMEQAQGSNFSYLGFNLDDPIIGQKAVREAIAYAIDRQAIIRHILGNAARTADALLPPEHWAGHQNLSPYPHDIDKARRLLADLGYTLDNPLKLVYKTSSQRQSIRLASVLQHQLKQVGIEVELRSYDWGTFYDDIKSGRFQMYSLSWVGIKNPDIFHYVFHSDSVPPNGANRGRYRSEQADTFIETATLATNIQQQSEQYRALQAHLLKDLPYVPLWYKDQILLRHKQVKNYQIYGDGRYDGLLKVTQSIP